jgi:hypothetical protein
MGTDGKEKLLTEEIEVVDRKEKLLTKEIEVVNRGD